MNTKRLLQLTKITLILILIFSLSIPLLVQAAEDSEMIGYLQKIYKFGIGAIGIVAALVLMLGGLTWITAMGNAQRVGEAKAWIAAALSGLLIALFSWLILNTINPSLVNPRINKPNIPAANKQNINNNLSSPHLMPLTSPHQEQEKINQKIKECKNKNGISIRVNTVAEVQTICNNNCEPLNGKTVHIYSAPGTKAIFCCTCE